MQNAYDKDTIAYLKAAGVEGALLARVERLIADNEKALARHKEIVQSIYDEIREEHKVTYVLLARPAARGHRYYGMRCVWCNVNSDDEMIYDKPEGKVCPGPEHPWPHNWWPLEEIDKAITKARGWEEK